MNVRLSRSKLVMSGVAAAVLIGGGASIAAASGNSPGTQSATEDSDGEHADGPDGGPGSEQEDTDPAFTGSVAAPADTEQADGQENAGSDEQEQATLQALATTSRAQAEQAALTAVPGTVAETDLDAENGFVVYSVEVNATDGTVVEVTVDAGNGGVLAQQVQDASDPADSPDQPESANDPQD